MLWWYGNSQIDEGQRVNIHMDDYLDELIELPIPCAWQEFSDL